MSKRLSRSRRSEARHRPDGAITCLVDENVPYQVADALEEMGVEVVRAKEAFPEGTPDTVLARIAEARGWIVVTGDKSDFNKMLSRARKTHEQKQYYRAGAIWLVLDKPRRALERWRRIQTSLLCEMANSEAHRDKRVFIEVRDDWLKIWR